MRCPKQANSQKLRGKVEVSHQGWGKGGMESYCLMGRDFQFKMTALEMPSGDGCITVWIYYMPLNCTPKSHLNGKFCFACILPPKRKSMAKKFYKHK